MSGSPSCLTIECDIRAMALGDPPRSCAAGREQFTSSIDSGRDLSGVTSERRVRSSCSNYLIGEFDPGSGRTLAACLTHASRGRVGGDPGMTGERVRNT